MPDQFWFIHLNEYLNIRGPLNALTLAKVPSCSWALHHPCSPSPQAPSVAMPVTARAAGAGLLFEGTDKAFSVILKARVKGGCRVAQRWPTVPDTGPNGLNPALGHPQLS